jgi:hypothetical protein
VSGATMASTQSSAVARRTDSTSWVADMWSRALEKLDIATQWTFLQGAVKELEDRLREVHGHDLWTFCTIARLEDQRNELLVAVDVLAWAASAAWALAGETVNGQQKADAKAAARDLGAMATELLRRLVSSIEPDSTQLERVSKKAIEWPHTMAKMLQGDERYLAAERVLEMVCTSKYYKRHWPEVRALKPGCSTEAHARLALCPPPPIQWFADRCPTALVPTACYAISHTGSPGSPHPTHDRGQTG